MQFSSVWVMVGFMAVVVVGQCPKDEGKRKLLEELLVKENPTHFMHSSQYTYVWVRKYIRDVCGCYYDKYTKKDDKLIEDISVCKLSGGKSSDGSPETVVESDKTGLYKLCGVYDTTSTKYAGLSYIIYADSHAIAYYACEAQDTNWNIGVQVKSSEWSGLASLTASDVKHSLNEAYKKMSSAADIMDLDVGTDIVSYDFETSC